MMRMSVCAGQGPCRHTRQLKKILKNNICLWKMKKVSALFPQR